MNLARFLLLWFASLSVFCNFWPQAACAAPGDEHWSAQFGVPGVTNNVSAIVTHNGRLYVSGTGGFTNTTLWIWDGNQWSILGMFAGSNPFIYDLAFVGNTLYAAGSFTNVNGVAAKGLARWDGSSWSDLGFNGTCYSLAVDGGNLYTGGIFTNAGSAVATNIARWTGGTWQALSNGLGRSTDFVISLAQGNGLLFAGGRFTNSGPVAVTNLAQWNGSGWTSVGGGVGGPSTFDRVYCLTFNGTDLFAGGIFTNAGATAANGIARWDGANWFALGSGIPAGANVAFSLASRNNQMFAAGTFNSIGGVNATNFGIWNGATWSAAGNGFSATANKVFVDGDRVYAGGGFAIAGKSIVNFISYWDGTNWNPIGRAGKINGLNSFVRALANDGTNLFAGGGFAYAGKTNALNVGRFDGTNWSAFGTGLNNNVLALAVVGTNLYAGGNFTGSAGGPSASHVARWNGANWVPLTNFFSAVVNSLATRGDDLFIAGYFTASAADGTSDWLVRWDGTNLWKAMAFPPDTFNQFYIDNIGFTAVAADANYVYVSGRCAITPCDPTWTDCTNCPNVMRFDGTYMHEMGTGLSSNANAIAVMDTDVFFGGPFTNAGGVTVSGIARWNGSEWFDVGGGIVGRGLINALAVMGTNLYAGGTFTNMGGTTVSRIARWDGSTWTALGSGVAFSATAGTVSALTVMGDDLYVGGTIRTSGGKPANFLARWNEGMNFDEAILQLSQPVGNPGGPFQFTVASIGVPTYVIDASTNLTQWTAVLTNTLTPYDYAEPNALAIPRRFYRARSLP